MLRVGARRAAQARRLSLFHCPRNPEGLRQHSRLLRLRQLAQTPAVATDQLDIFLYCPAASGTPVLVIRAADRAERTRLSASERARSLEDVLRNRRREADVDHNMADRCECHSEKSREHERKISHA